VDVTECPVDVPFCEWMYYSAKKKRHTLKYELACSFRDSCIVWVSGGFPGSMHD